MLYSSKDIFNYALSNMFQRIMSTNLTTQQIQVNYRYHVYMLNSTPRLTGNKIPARCHNTPPLFNTFTASIHLPLCRKINKIRDTQL